MKILFLLCYFLNIFLASNIDFIFSKKEQLKNEIKSIGDSKITLGRSFFPYTDSSIEDFSKINLVKNNKNFKLSPIFAIRYSSSGFEIFEENSPSSVLWISPGLEMNYIKPITFGFFDTGINFQAWTRFNKHSAYGFNGIAPSLDQVMFQFNPDHSFEFYSNSKQPSNGIDFDEGQASISLNSNFFNFIFGKFKTNIGPFHSGNLSISYSAPAFPQFQLRTKSKKLNFSFIVGELQSDMSINIDGSEIIRKRYIVNHRIDFMLKDNLKIGFYEQVISGDNLSLSYFLPVIPYWSAQHANRDKDNLQMGFDLELLSNNNKFIFSLIVDEWAPFDTFNKNHHNWFGSQIGFSRILSQRGIFKFEYTMIEPQVYVHDIPINQAFNGDYPIGFWSMGDSEELYFGFTYFFDNYFELDISLRNTNLGTPYYGDSPNKEVAQIKNRFFAGIQLSKKINTKIGSVSYLFKMNHLKTSNIYENENFVDYQISLLYNINY